MSSEKNRLSYWFPLLASHAVPQPMTTVVRTDVGLVDVLDGVTPANYPEFIEKLQAAGDHIGWPVFMRTGFLAAKHGWSQTCFVPSRDRIGAHVAKLVEESELVDIIALPSDEWVLRKMIRPMIGFTAFDGLPISRDQRMFIKGGSVLCVHPYWPADAIQRPSIEDWEQVLLGLNTIGREEMDRVLKLGRYIAGIFKDDGAWSVDLLYDAENRVWLCTDMGVAQESYHWPDCPVGERFEREREASKYP